MDKIIIKAMVKALKPALKDPNRAEQIMERFWRNKMALVWNVEDVHTAANERKAALTNDDAIKVPTEPD